MERLRNVILLLLGTLISDWGLASFLVPNNFIDGGVTGISMLISQFFGAPLALWIFLVNLPFVFLAFRHISVEFGVMTLIAIAAAALWLVIIPFPIVTSDPLLASLFGGVFVGAGVGLAIRGGCVTDGTEILAVILSKRMAATVGEIILGSNIVIFLVAAFVVGAESAMYSVLTYFAASKTIDFIIHGIEAYNGVTVLSSHNELVRKEILAQLGRGVTILKGVGGYTSNQHDVLYCVVTRLELPKLQSIIHDIDENAFVVVTPVHEVHGGMIKRRPI